MSYNIGVIGIGRLGLSMALLCAHRGYTVIGSDTRQDYIDSLNNRTFRSKEPDINRYLDTVDDRFLATTDNRKVLERSDVVFLFVPTPSLPTGEYDHQYIEQVVSEIEQNPVSGKLLVIGCTVMPGYTQTVADRLEQYGITVVYNPEFIAQGEIVKGLKTADMVLVGTWSQVVQGQLREIYETIMDNLLNMKVMSPTAAEITKIAINCFLTMKIAYANMIGEIAINSGVEQEITTILQAIGDDTRIGYKYLGYGFGYGGPCLPRDERALGLHANKVGIYSVIPEAIDNSNSDHNQFLKEYYIERNPDMNKPFIFTQLSYKAGTGILTESQHYRLACELQDIGYMVYTTEQTEQTRIPLLTDNINGYTI